MTDVRQILAEFQNGLGELQKEVPGVVEAFIGIQDATFGDSAISKKTKELISVAMGIEKRCKYCIVAHVYNAYEAGATRQEILEAAMVAMGGFGSGPSMAYSATLLLDAVNEFEKDFK